MKNTVMTFLVSALAFCVIGCTGGTDAAPKTASNQPADQKPASGGFKVALITPGPVSDSGWNALAYDGLMAIQKGLGAEVKNDDATGTKIKDSMRSYAQDGYNLVIGHGFEYNDPEAEVAANFPKTVFVSSSGGKTGANFGAFRFALEQGFYLAGALAAEMSKTGKIAMIGGPKVPSIESTFNAFRAGAMAEKKGIQVFEEFTGKDSDIQAAKQLTEAQLAKGADVVIHQANAAAQGVFDACKEKNVWALGANLNQNDNASGVVIASAVIVAQPAFLELAKAVKAGTYKGEITTVGMDKGAIDFIVNPKLQAKIPADVLKKLEDMKAKIKSGALSVPMDKF
ncbi:MAG: BMP family protein [Armatimonadetes bacterium]|nr:BMP family protein [Armatimonadota bacterium]